MALSKKALSKHTASIARAEDVTSSRVKPTISASGLVALARNYSRKAIDTMSRIMEDESTPPAVRIRAAEILLERGYGKAAQAVVVGNADGSPMVGPQMLSIAERIAALKKAKETKDDTIDLEANSFVEVPELDQEPVAPPEAVQEESVREDVRSDTDIL